MSIAKKPVEGRCCFERLGQGKVDHKCCDVCTKTCSCGITVHPIIHPIKSDSPKRLLVLPRQEEYLQQLLIEHAC